MSSYIIAYHGGKKFESPEDCTKHMAKWKAWIAVEGIAGLIQFSLFGVLLGFIQKKLG